jgi:hypothetical protein
VAMKVSVCSVCIGLHAAIQIVAFCVLINSAFVGKIIL